MQVDAKGSDQGMELSTAPHAALKVLERIAINVATHPGEKKYRKLNLSKPKIEKVSYE